MPLGNELTPEEIALYYQNFPTLAPDAYPGLGGPPTLAPPVTAPQVPVAPEIATGQAPATMAPSSITQGHQQLLAESQARAAALAAQGGPGLKEALQFGLAAGSDIASTMAAIRRGRGATGTGATDEVVRNIAGMAQKRQEQILAERKFQADVLNNIGASSSRDMEARQKAYAILGDTLKNPLATDEDRQRAVSEATGYLAQAGQDGRLAGQVFQALIRRPEVATLMGDYAPAFDPKNEGDQKRLKLLESEVLAATFSGPEGAKRIPELIKAAVTSKVGPEVGRTVLETARNLRGLPEFKDGIPVSVLYDKFAGKYGDKGAQAYIDYLQGRLGTETPEGQTKYQNFQKAMTDAGFKGIGVTEKAQEAGATTRATELAKTSPEVTASAARAKNEIERATRGETLNTKALENALDLQKAEGLKRMEQTYKRGEPLGPAEISNVREEFTRGSKAFIEVRDAYGKIQVSAQKPSPAGDLSLIFGYMKMLDPGSTVREGEQASAAQARGVPDAVLGLYNRLLTGEKLTDDQRRDFVDRAEKLFGVYRQSHENLEQSYRGLAKTLQIDPDKVVIDYMQQYRGVAKTPALPTPTHRFDSKTGKMIPVK